MKKRLIAVFAATVVAASTLLAVGCKKSSSESDANEPAASEPAASETYTGEVSAQAYDSQTAAASDCIAKEINGPDYQVEMTNYTKDADLTETEIQNLNVSAKVDGTIESVEKGKIYFREVPGGRAVETAYSQESQLYITVYIIKYTFTPQGSTTSTTKYEYMIPLPETNEVLSYSYYNSVMNPDNFKNCTATLNSTTTISISATGYSQSNTTKQTLQITESVVKMSLTVPIDENGKTVNADVYLVDTPNGVKCAMEVMGQCEVVSAADLQLDISSISELYSENLNEAQYSLFVKTDSGFKMRSEAFNGIVDSVFDAVFSQYESMGATIDWDLGNASADYKVVDGKLYKASTNMSITMDVTVDTQNVSMNVVSKAETVYSNYGTTSVTISNAAKQALELN